MSPVDLKLLKKLASTCRKLGIQSFKTQSFEFTLSDDIRAVEKSSKKQFKSSSPLHSLGPDDDFKTDSLTEEELLLWSSQSEETDSKEIS